MSRWVFIDLGCHDGDSVEEFRNWRKVAFDPDMEWDIYAFDPNPNFKDRWKIVEDEHTHFYQKAAWIKDDTVGFALADDPLGSTIIPEKEKSWNNSQHIRVKTFDFSKWLKKFKDNFVVVKMDIEGAEFELLEKMIADDTDKICDYLLVEFHPNKVTSYTTDDKNNLIKRLKDRQVNILEWH